MSEAHAPDPATVAHLTLIAEERLRATRWSLALRPLSLAAVTAVAVLHAPMNPSRYMFLAPALALSAWYVDAGLARRVRALDALASALQAGASPRPARLAMDLDAWAPDGAWRVAILGGPRARWFLPLSALAAAIAIDAQRFGPDDAPGEIVWYLALLMMSLGAASLAAWSWWLDRFGEGASAPRPAPAVAPALAAPPRPAVDLAAPFAPRASREPEPARWEPRHDPNERPFPEGPRTSVEPPPARSGTTQTFATVELDEARPESQKPD